MYLRSLDTAVGVYTSLIMAKTHVAPIKKFTLPRLELCGAHLLSQLRKISKKSWLSQPAIFMPSLTVPMFFIGSMVEVSVSRPSKQTESEKFKKMLPLKNGLMSSAKKTQLMLDHTRRNHCSQSLVEWSQLVERRSFKLASQDFCPSFIEDSLLLRH